MYRPRQLPSLPRPKYAPVVFWDRQGVLLVEYLPLGTTINSAVYCETLKKLRHAIQNNNITSSVYDCTVEDVEYIYNTLSLLLLLKMFILS